MAGQPSFTRAKRHHFFHTTAEVQAAGSLEINPTTSLILHPTTDLVASPEGSFIVRTTASFVGDVSIGGDLFVGGSMIITSSVLHKGDNVFGDEAGDAHKFIGTTTASGDLIVDVDLHVKTNASVDGTLVAAGITTLVGALKANSTASIDSTLKVGGKTTLYGVLHEKVGASLDSTLTVGGVFRYNQFIAASVLTTDPNVEGAIGMGVKGANTGWIKTYNITTATYIYSPYWVRG